MMDAVFLSLFYLSASLRSSNVPGAPHDWEFAGGLAGERVKAEYVAEREVGVSHYGMDLRVSIPTLRGHAEISGSHFKRTAKEIDIQKAKVNYIITNRPFLLKTGLGAVSRRWGYEGTRWGCKAQKNGLSVSLEADLEALDKLESAEIEFRRALWEGGETIKLQMEPLASYRMEGDREFWQAKIRLVLSVRSEKKED